jgi:multimeric flavodoxin WrbA
MKKIVIVYHSGYGHTKKVAEAVAEGSGGSLLAIDAEGNLPAEGWAQLGAADAVVFGSPTYMGSVSWQFKKFADASSKPWFTQQWKNKLAAGFTNSATLNGDKFSTLSYLFTLSQQHGMFWVGAGMMPVNHKAATRDHVNNLGAYSGLITATPSDASVDEMVPGDIATAKAFGARVAEAAAQFVPRRSVAEQPAAALQ